LRVAVTVALPSGVIVPAVAVNVAAVELAATVTEAGTVNVALFDDNATLTPPAGAACDTVTVQFVLALDVIVEAAHCREDTLTGSCRVSVAGTENPLSEAVTVPL